MRLSDILKKLSEQSAKPQRKPTPESAPRPPAPEQTEPVSRTAPDLQPAPVQEPAVPAVPQPARPAAEPAAQQPLPAPPVPAAAPVPPAVPQPVAPVPAPAAAAEPAAPAAPAGPVIPPVWKDDAGPRKAPVRIRRPGFSAEQVYTEAILEIKGILAHLAANEFYSDPLFSVDKIAELIAEQDEEIILLADRTTPDVYLYGHSVNVCILSLFIGRAMGLEKTQLAALGRCAFLHDIGMVRFMDMVLKNGKLTPAEHAQVQRHVSIGQDMVAGFSGLDEETRTVASHIILQTHERRNGSGYPNGLKDDEIHRFARVIAIADTYEAITHPRPYRASLIPHEAVKFIITHADREFDSDIVKSFVEHMSLYPPGSFVRLNTEEVARVCGLNPGLPTRPSVRVIIDASGHRVPELKTIDLSATPMLFIREPVDETKLKPVDKRLYLELKAMRWWVKGI